MRLDGVYRAVFFDLDGTLVDTAPDMVGVLQAVQRDHGNDAVPYEMGRSQVSNGVLGLLRVGFPEADDARIEQLRLEYLDRYANSVCERSRVFTGIDPLIDRLDDAHIPWGVVTNKPEKLTLRLLEALELLDRVVCTVGGDTLPVRKPDPAPLLHACEIAAVESAESIYVGDAARDIDAGKAAGMATIAAAYGYISPGDDASRWGADLISTDTKELAQMVFKAVNLET